MADVDDLLSGARVALFERRWAEARRGFAAARELGALNAEDMAGLGEAEWWLGEIDGSLRAFEEAYRLLVAEGELAARAAGRLAMEIGYFWSLRGEEAIGSGWFGRAHRLLGSETDCVEYGYLRSVAIDEAIAQADFEAAINLAKELLALSRRHGDETLASVALAGEGIAMIKQGHVTEGLSILDEAMLPVVAGRVEAAYAGNIYCQLMQVCQELVDVRRAEQWTDATERWCDGFESAVMFMGVCRVHRAQLMHRRGDWDRAEAEAREVCATLASMNVSAVGESYYQLGEVSRLRGEMQSAADAYREARLRGRDPQPGQALLRLAEGQIEIAARDVGAALAVAVDDLARAPLWAAQAEVELAAGNLDVAQQAAFRLTDTAELYGSSGLVVEAALARGRVALAQGDMALAVTELQSACRQWQELGARHDVARTRVLLAVAHRATGNTAAAEAELDSAAAVFADLGARLDVDDVARMQSPEELPGGLTAREAEVLRVISQGNTNRQAAEELFLSEKTVSRHLHNIYTKLGISSRTAAAAYAFEHGLASPSD